MSTIEVKPHVKVQLNEILAGISTLDVRELESFFNQVGTMLARRKTPHLTEREHQLLLEINKGLSLEHRRNYLNLKEKSLAQKLNELERQELLALSDEIEQAGARRLAYLVELSKLRGVSLKEVMNQLGIKTPLAYA